MSRPVSTTRRQVLIDALAGAGAMGLLPIANALAASGNTTPSSIAPSTGDVHDFDPFFGRWRQYNRRLKQRLAGSDEWVEFGGSVEYRPLLGGSGNMGDNVFDMPDGAYRGVSLRAFDPGSRTWASWWLDGRNPNRIEVPVIGSFDNGVGTFLSDDTFDGKPIKVRVLWSKITARSMQWEQAFSPDGGRHWETNWLTTFSRAD